MKVLYIFRDPINGGHSIEELFNNIIEHLPSDIDVKVFYYDQKKCLLSNVLRLRKMHADIFHITGDIYYLSLFLPFKKVVLTLHDLGHYKNLNGWRKFFYGLFWIWLPFMNARAITCVSNYTKNDFNTYYPSIRKTIQVVPNPAPSIFKYQPKIESTEKFRILQVGTGFHKNLTTVLSSIRDISCTLVIIGPLNGYLYNLLAKYGIEYENYFHLTREEVYQQYVLCDVVSFVTTHEGFGMPVLEAQAVGRPIITSNVCSLPEITNGSTPMIDNPMDSASLRSIFLKLIHDPLYRDKFIQLGLKNAQQYNIKKIMPMYLSIYRTIAK